MGYNRRDMFFEAMLNDDVSKLPDPVSSEEMVLHKMAKAACENDTFCGKEMTWDDLGRGNEKLVVSFEINGQVNQFCKVSDDIPSVPTGNVTFVFNGTTESLGSSECVDDQGNTYGLIGALVVVALQDGATYKSYEDFFTFPEAGVYFIHNNPYGSITHVEWDGYSYDFDGQTVEINKIPAEYLPAVFTATAKVNVTTEDGETYTSNKTYAEITEMISNGYSPVCILDEAYVLNLCHSDALRTAMTYGGMDSRHNFSAVVGTLVLAVEITESGIVNVSHCNFATE